MPDSLENINEGAFWGFAPKTLTIGKGLRDWEKHDTLEIRTEIIISPSNQWLHVENGNVVRKKNSEGAIPRP